MSKHTCNDCHLTIHRNPADPDSEAWTEQFIADHQAIHDQQLEEHDGDREALRRRLRHPAHHAAIEHAAKTAEPLPHWPYKKGYNPPGGTDRKPPKPPKGHMGSTIHHKVR